MIQSTAAQDHYTSKSPRARDPRHKLAEVLDPKGKPASSGGPMENKMTTRCSNQWCRALARWTLTIEDIGTSMVTRQDLSFYVACGSSSEI